ALTPTPLVELTVPGGAAAGAPVTLTSKVTDRGAVDTAVGFTYAWTILRNGTPFATFATPNVTFTPTANGVYIIQLTVTDKDGGQGKNAAALVVADADPVAVILGAPASSPEGAPITLLSAPTDPIAADSLSYTCSVT